MRQNVTNRPGKPVRKSCRLMLAIILAGCAGQKAAVKQAPKIPLSDVQRTMQFAGADGIVVRAVELKGKPRAIIIVTGTRSRIEGKALLHEISESSRSMWFTTQIGGREFSTLSRERTRWGNNTRWRLRLPEDWTRSIDLVFNKDKGDKLDPKPLLAAHQAQLSDGSLDALQRFDQAAERAKEMQGLTAKGDRLAKSCGAKPALQIDWSTIDDELLKKKSISSYCGYAADALQHLCSKSAQVANFVRSSIKAYRCRFGDKLALSVEGGALTWTVSEKGRNLQRFAREQLQLLKHHDLTLQQHVAVSKTKVCVDRKSSRYFAIAPAESEHPGLAYGDGNTLQQVRTPRLIGGGWFFDPRQYNERHNANMRGHDLRYYSYLSMKRDKQSCKLVCGTRKTDLAVATAEEARKVLLAATYKAPKEGREPYALARDRRGTYYYVDRGTAEDRRRDFRLFVGPLGRLKQSKMKDIVSDSEGEIFSSKRGQLRLVLGKKAAMWIRGKRRRELLWVPVQENYRLIYNELGVYLGQQLGTPCDHY